MGLARLIEDYEEVAAAISEAASVLNRPLEAEAARRAAAEVRRCDQFEDVTFTYVGTKSQRSTG